MTIYEVNKSIKAIKNLEYQINLTRKQIIKSQSLAHEKFEKPRKLTKSNSLNIVKSKSPNKQNNLNKKSSLINFKFSFGNIVNKLNIIQEKIQNIKKIAGKTLNLKIKVKKAKQNVVLAKNKTTDITVVKTTRNLTKIQSRINGIRKSASKKMRINFSSRKAIKAMRSVKTRFNNLKKSLKSKIGNIFIKITASGFDQVKKFVGQTVKVCKEFDETMEKVKKSTKTTDESYKKLEASAKQIGATTSISANEAAEGMIKLSKAGWNTNETVGGMPSIANLAMASQIGLSDAIGMVTKQMETFNIPAEKSSQVVETLARTAKGTKASISSIGSVMNNLAPEANSFGSSLEQTSALLEMLTKSGLNVNKAGNIIKNAFGNMVNPTADAQRKLKDMGLSLKDQSGHMKGMDTIIGDLNSKFSQMSQAEKLKATKSIFNSNEKDAKSLLSVIEKGPQKFNKLAESISKSKGIAPKMAMAKNDNLDGDVAKFNSKLQSIQLNAGEKLKPFMEDIENLKRKLIQLATVSLPVLEDAVNALIKVFNKIYPYVEKVLIYLINGMQKATPKIEKVAISLIRGFEKATPIIEKIVKVLAKGFEKSIPIVEKVLGIIKFFSPVIASVAIAIGLVVGYMKMIAIYTKLNALYMGIVSAYTMLTTIWANKYALIQLLLKSINPFTAIIVGIAVVIGLGIMLYKHWDFVKQKLSAIWNSIKLVFSVGKTAIVNILKNFAQSHSKLIKPFIGLVKSIKTMFSGIIDFISGIFTGNWKKSLLGIKSIFSGFVNVLKGEFGIFKNIGQKVGQTLSSLKLFDKAKLMNSLKSLAEVTSIILKPFEGMIMGIKTMFSGLIIFISGVFTGNWQKAFEGVKTIFTGYIDILVSKFEIFKNIGLKIGEVIGNLNIFDKDKLVSGLKSLSGIAEIVLKPFQTTINGLKISLSGLIAFITEVFSGNWSKAFEGIKSIFDGFINSVLNKFEIFKNGFDKLKNIAVKIGLLKEDKNKHKNSIETATDKSVRSNPALDKISNSASVAKEYLSNKTSETIKIFQEKIEKLVKVNSVKEKIIGFIKANFQEEKIKESYVKSNDIKSNKTYDLKKQNNKTQNTTTKNSLSNKSETKSVKIVLQKIADSVVIREEADIDKIVEKFADLLESGNLNFA